MSLVIGPDRDGRVIHVVGDRLAQGSVDPVAGDPPADRLDCAGARIEPGRINAHTHLYSGLAGLDMPPPRPTPENFVQILERVWWRLDRGIDEASFRAGVRLYVAEALLAGTTTIIDHNESPNLIEGCLTMQAEDFDALGVRGLLCYGATERNGGREEARRGLAECRRFIETNASERLVGAVALHASFTVSDETVREAGELCRELEAILHVHMAEDGADVVDAKQRGFEGPLERLIELDALPPGSILAHGVHLNEAQVRRATDEVGCWFVQNPRSNRGNGVGYPLALKAGSKVALGTDGYPARMEEEQQVLRELAREHGDDMAAVERRVRDGHRLAAQLWGGEFSLSPGSFADLCVIGEEGVRHVVVGGRVVVQGGALMTANIDEIRATAQEQAPRLWQRLEAL